MTIQCLLSMQNTKLDTLQVRYTTLWSKITHLASVAIMTNNNKTSPMKTKNGKLSAVATKKN